MDADHSTCRFRWVVCQIDSLQRLRCDVDIIIRALATLPRTLDETYERIFLQVPEEARIFVYHALKWIYAHNELHNNNISCAILLQAVQKTASELAPSTYAYHLDEELLRDFCGCLVSVSRDSRIYNTIPNGLKYQLLTVSFAHYTVLEFLNSSRMRNGPACFFAFGQESAKLEYANMLVIEALTKTDERLSISRNPDISDVDTIATAVNHDITCYSIVSSILVVRKWASILPEQGNFNQSTIFKLFDESRTHFQTFEYILSTVEEFLVSFFSDRGLYGGEKFWCILWRIPAIDSCIKTLINLLFTDQSGRLAQKFLHRAVPQETLRNQLELRIEVWDAVDDADDDIEWYEFRGSVVELFAQLVFKWPGHLRLLVNFGAECIEPSVVLQSLVGWHVHNEGYTYYTCEHYCPLLRLLQLGADPDGRCYNISPLQMAVAAWDFDGVKILLEAGANPNYTGNQDGLRFDGKSQLGLFNAVRGMRPLDILNSVGCLFGGHRKKERGESPEKIREVLVRYLARSVSVTRKEMNKE